jgi:type IX secretion system PorP/SprF family membrane protein
MFKRCIIRCLFCLPFAVTSQDIHFSQTAQIPLLINPACAGVYDGWERINLNQRNQWLGAGTQFMTSSVAADINLGKSGFSNKAHVGIGVMFYNDIGGDASFGTQYGSLTMSGILPAGGGHTFSAGIQGGFGSRKADFSKLTFSSQWNGTHYDQTSFSGEANGMSGFTFFDASAGFYYVYDASKSSFRRKDNFRFQLGLAGYHLNQPEINYTIINGDRIYRKYVFHASILKDILMTDWSAEANVFQVCQGPHRETVLGFIAKHRFRDGTKITGFSQDAYIGFGAYFRWKDAFCPAIQIDWKGFHLGMSYDVTISSMRKAYTGSLEFSLTYTNLNHALFKTRNNRRN